MTPFVVVVVVVVVVVLVVVIHKCIMTWLDHQRSKDLLFILPI